jgi:hypothetical protein
MDLVQTAFLVVIGAIAWGIALAVFPGERNDD